MSLAQDIRNAYEWRDRDALERALAKLPNGVAVSVSFADALDPELACIVCGTAQKKHGTYPTCASHHFTASAQLGANGEQCKHALLISSSPDASKPGHPRCVNCGEQVEAVLAHSHRPRCSNMHCGGPRSNGECGLSTPGSVYMGHCQSVDSTVRVDQHLHLGEPMTERTKPPL